MKRVHFLIPAIIFVISQCFISECSARVQLKMDGTQNNDALTVSLINNTDMSIILPQNFHLSFKIKGLFNDERYFSHRDLNFKEKLIIKPGQTIRLFNTRLSNLKWSPLYWSNDDYIPTKDVLETIKINSQIVIQVGLYASSEECLCHNYLSNYLNVYYSRGFFTGTKIYFEEPTDLLFNRAHIEIVEIRDCNIVKVRISNLRGTAEESQGKYEIQLNNRLGWPISKCLIELNMISRVKDEKDVYEISLENHFPDLKKTMAEENCVSIWIIFFHNKSKLQLESNTMRVGK